MLPCQYKRLYDTILLNHVMFIILHSNVNIIHFDINNDDENDQDRLYINIWHSNKIMQTII